MEFGEEFEVAVEHLQSEAPEDLDEAFEAATAHVAAIAGGKELSSDDKLAFYGFYKQATDGPCKTFRPNFFDRVARAKWAAWNNLGEMTPAAAKAGYVALLCQLQPNFNPASGKASGKGSGGGPMGPVFSTMAADDGGPSALEAKLGPESGSLHILASEGNVKALEQLVRSGIDLNTRDSEGCSALHWAGDRGCLEAISLLVDCGADVDARDADGMTPLHYAALCEQHEACQLLIQLGADVGAKDKEGNTARDKGPAAWDCWPT